MAKGLGAFAGGNTNAIFAAMAAAVLFGALHALMPGRKIVWFFTTWGSRPRCGKASGMA